MAALALSFHETQFDIVDRDSQPWLRSPQIGGALGYKKGSDSVLKLYDSNKDEFTDTMTALVELETSGGIQQVRIFSLRGCHLLAMFARTKVAKEFRKWVLDILEHYAVQEHNPQYSQFANPEPKTKKALPGGLTLDQQDAIKALVKKRVEVLPKDKQAKAAITCWSSLKSKFHVKTYKELPPESFSQAVSLLARLPLEGEFIPKGEQEATAQVTDDFDYAHARRHVETLKAISRVAVDDCLKTEFDAELEKLEKCLVRAWTEMDEAIFRLSHAMTFLKRWRNK